MSYGNLAALFAAANAVEGASVNQGSLLYRENEVDAYMAVLWSALYASDESELRYPTDTIRRDAFRHGYWSALLTDALGATYAEIATTTYEDETPDNDGISRDMDIFNNEVGRLLASGQYFDTYEQCGDMIDEAIDQGKFKIIVNNELIWTGNRTTGISINTSNVYLGPDTIKYPTLDSVQSNQIVDIIWQEGSWYFIEFIASSNITRGYILSNNISDIIGNVTTKIHSFSGNTTNSTASIYTGPGNNFKVAGSVDKAEVITLLNDSKNDYKMIEYKTGANTRKRGYIDITKLNSFDIPNYQTFIENEFISNSPVSCYNGWRVTQGYNDHFTNFKGHLGYDMKPGSGMSDEIKPVYSGYVVYVDKSDTKSNGCIVVVEHNLSSNVFYSSYSHLKYSTVNSLYDEWINANQRLYVDTSKKLGEMGGTGGNEGIDVFSPHLHLMIYTLGTASSFSTNPYGYCATPHDKPCEVVDTGFNGIFYNGDHSSGRKIYDPFGFINTNGDIINI